MEEAVPFHPKESYLLIHYALTASGVVALTVHSAFRPIHIPGADTDTRPVSQTIGARQVLHRLGDGPMPIPFV